MKYNQGVCETVVRTVPVGDVVADTAYMIGAECLVAVKDGTAGSTDGVFVKRGCCGLTFKAGDSPAAGAACYLNNTTHEVEGTPSATNYLIGCRNSNLESGLPATRIMVDLDGTAASVYGVPGDIQGVTAGTGLSGGGTSGTVSVALSAGSIASLGKADTALQAADIANMATMAVDSAGAKKVVRSGGANKTLVADGPDYDLLPTMAAVGGAGELLYTAAADRAVAKSGILATDVMLSSKFTSVDVTIALGADTGSSAADPTLVGAGILGFYPKSGNDQPVESVTLNGDGSVTVVTAAVETAEAKFKVIVSKP